MSSISLLNNANALSFSALTAPRTQTEGADAPSAGGRTAKDVRAASNFVIAQSQRNELHSLNAVTESLTRAKSVLEAATSAGDTVADLLLQMKEKALAASDAKLTAAARGKLDSDFKILRDRIAKTVADAKVGSSNLVGAGAQDLHPLVWHKSQDVTQNNGQGPGETKANGPDKSGNVKSMLAHIQAGPKTSVLPTMTIRAASLSLGGANVTVKANASIATAKDAAKALEDVKASIQNVTAARGRLDVDGKALDSRMAAVERLHDTLESSVAKLLDGDLDRDKARALAAQTRDALKKEAYTVANAAPKVMLSLLSN
jgi:flagellin